MYKFIVENKRQSDKLQKVLFACGYEWEGFRGKNLTLLGKNVCMYVIESKIRTLLCQTDYENITESPGKLLALDFLEMFNDDGTVNKEVCYTYSYDLNFNNPISDWYARYYRKQYQDHIDDVVLTLDHYKLLKNYKSPYEEELPINEEKIERKKIDALIDSVLNEECIQNSDVITISNTNIYVKISTTKFPEWGG